MVTQIVMTAVLVATAATIGAHNSGVSLNSVGDIANGLVPFLGHTNAVLFFALGMLGAAMIAALVVSLAGAWGVSEVLGWRNDSPRRAYGFYGLAVLAPLGGALLVISPRFGQPLRRCRAVTYVLSGIVIALGLFTAVQTITGNG